ncbi:MAG: hypothetical protein IPG64_11010 [Haliea sp.]|nr:hypothetical protein [Haliea sp.]
MYRAGSQPGPQVAVADGYRCGIDDGREKREGKDSGVGRSEREQEANLANKDAEIAVLRDSLLKQEDRLLQLEMALLAMQRAVAGGSGQHGERPAPKGSRLPFCALTRSNARSRRSSATAAVKHPQRTRVTAIDHA